MSMELEPKIAAVPTISEDAGESWTMLDARLPPIAVVRFAEP